MFSVSSLSRTVVLQNVQPSTISRKPTDRPCLVSSVFWSMLCVWGLYTATNVLHSKPYVHTGDSTLPTIHLPNRTVGATIFQWEKTHCMSTCALHATCNSVVDMVHLNDVDELIQWACFRKLLSTFACLDIMPVTGNILRKEITQQKATRHIPALHIHIARLILCNLEFRVLVPSPAAKRLRCC